ncbi:MAG TPA: ankyrin repeat domain-containing protein [Gammaproteobacteria bacterium]|nr:ankyrin repeat domain-containing protein [Gammaproteobacteria bacterium]
MDEVKALIENTDINIDFTDNNTGDTALMLAAQYGHEGIVARLLKAGAKVDLTNEDGSTALMWAAEDGHEGIVARLLKAGANARHANNNHDTAMSLAAKNKHPSVVITLIKAGGFEPSQFKDKPDLTR